MLTVRQNESYIQLTPMGRIYYATHVVNVFDLSAPTCLASTPALNVLVFTSHEVRWHSGVLKKWPHCPTSPTQQYDKYIMPVLTQEHNIRGQHRGSCAHRAQYGYVAAAC